MKTLGDFGFDYDYNSSEGYVAGLGAGDEFPMVPSVVQSDYADEADILSTVESVAQAQIDKGMKTLQTTGITQEAKKYGLNITKERIMLMATAYLMFKAMRNKYVWLGVIGAGAYLFNKRQGEASSVIAPKAPIVHVEQSSNPEAMSAEEVLPASASDELSGWI
jgi:hypothetical protein